VIHAPPITNTNAQGTPSAQRTPSAQGTPSVSEGASLPPTPRAEQLLIALAAADFDTTKVLATGAFTIIEIADLTADETFQKRQAALMSLKKTALTLQAIEARQACMKALKHVVEATEDLVEKRRAATALLRATTAALIPTTERHPRAPKDKQPDPPPDPPAPEYTPDPSYEPQTVANIIAHAARTVDDPEPNTGLATIAAFASETATIEDQPFAPEDPGDQDAINDSIDTLANSSLNQARNSPTHWTSRKPIETSAHHCQHFRGFYIKKTDSRHELAITLTKSQAPDSRAPDCWLVSALTVRRILPQY
jgi:hypothetical protein